RYKRSAVRREKRDRPGDILRRSQASKRRNLTETVRQSTILLDDLLVEGRVQKTRRHRIDPDTAFPKLHRQRLGQPDHPGLARRVTDAGTAEVNPGRHIDNAAAARTH